MKKLFLFLFVALLMFSCVQNQGTKNAQNEVLPVVSFVDSFRKSHPDWSNNSVTKEKANADYLEMIKDTALLYSLTEGIDVRLSSIRKNSDGKYVAQFYSWFAQDELRKHSVNEVAFDIVTTLNDSLVSVLKEGEYYSCKWNIIGSVDYNAFCILYGQKVTVINDVPEIRLDEYSKSVDVSLGLFYADLINIKPQGYYKIR